MRRELSHLLVDRDVLLQSLQQLRHTFAVQARPGRYLAAVSSRVLTGSLFVQVQSAAEAAQQDECQRSRDTTALCVARTHAQASAQAALQLDGAKQVLVRGVSAMLLRAEVFLQAVSQRVTRLDARTFGAHTALQALSRCAPLHARPCSARSARHQSGACRRCDATQAALAAQRAVAAQQALATADFQARAAQRTAQLAAARTAHASEVAALHSDADAAESVAESKLQDARRETVKLRVLCRQLEREAERSVAEKTAAHDAEVAKLREQMNVRC